MSDEPLVPDDRDIEVGRLTAFRGVIRDLIILVPLLITLAATIGNWFQGCSNGKGIAQHSEQLGQIQQVVDDKAMTIDKTAADVKAVKSAVGMPP